MPDFHELPKLRDSLSYIYVEHAIIDRKQNAIEYIQKDGRVMVPVAALCVLMLGPGTSISHAAMRVLADNGCSILWTGEDSANCYAFGMGETHKAWHVLRQAELYCDPAGHNRVVRNMYRYRFDDIKEDVTLQQMRGMEGSRIKQVYAHASREYGVSWSGRNYNRGSWNDADPVNRALSSANAVMNGICHAAITSGGYSTALGFIHTGRQLSFVYDIADLYKAEISIPAAFQTASESTANVEQRARAACRERIRETHLLNRILPDIDALLEIDQPSEDVQGEDPASELWEELY